ncbi:MAG: hypothetical protein ABI612_06390 [Betaproteobacteria bacterium]
MYRRRRLARYHNGEALKRKSIASDCFEQPSDLGGIWCYENDKGISSAYRSLHIDISRKNLGYHDFPIGGDSPISFTRDCSMYLLDDRQRGKARG